MQNYISLFFYNVRVYNNEYVSADLRGFWPPYMLLSKLNPTGRLTRINADITFFWNDFNLVQLFSQSCEQIFFKNSTGD